MRGIVHQFRIDESRTAAAYHTGVFKDAKQRSHFNNLGHVFLFGVDMEEQWERLYQDCRGKCQACGIPKRRDELDMDHAGRTPRTRCSCLHQLLNDGTRCTSIRMKCTMDPRKPGYRPNSCHAKRHNRETRFGERNVPQS
jgi:hypothetical protein